VGFGAAAAESLAVNQHWECPQSGRLMIALRIEGRPAATPEQEQD
jgi:hypothetical protein